MINCDWRTDAINPQRKACAREGCTNVLVTHNPPERCFAACEAIAGNSALVVVASGEPPLPPAVVDRAINFTKAVFKQLPLVGLAIVTGDESRAFRSQEEIEGIAGICKACPLFDGERCTHRNCGCPVNADRSQFWSKLAYKSQSCPDGKW